MKLWELMFALQLHIQKIAGPELGAQVSSVTPNLSLSNSTQ